MKKFKVLHISPTPLVDAPRKINDTLNLYSKYDSSIFIFKDYPGKLKGKFSTNVLIYDISKEVILSLLADADIIHIHNFLTIEQENIVLRYSKSDVIFVYQAHSPLREGPLFVNYADNSRIDYDKKCVIAQYHPRLYQDYVLVPNIILQIPTISLINDADTPKVLFSPTHKRVGGRWNDKASSELDVALNALEALGLIELVVAEGYTPHELYQLRKRCHISIDEIVTGAYHQVSLESMCAGNVTINNADIFSKLMLKTIIGKDVKVPFLNMNEFTIKEKLLSIVKDKKLIRKFQQDSYNFHIQYLQPEILIEHYINIYTEVLKK